MQPLRSDSHVERVSTDNVLCNEAWIGVSIETDGVASHVLNSASDRDVILPEADGSAEHGSRRHRTGAHTIKRETWDSRWKSGQDTNGSTQREPLVTLLCRRCNPNVVYALLWDRTIAFEETNQGLDREII